MRSVAIPDSSARTGSRATTIERALRDLERAAGVVRALAASAPSAEAVTTAVRVADGLNAAAAAMVGSLAGCGGIESATGLPAEMALHLSGRRLGWDAAELAGAAEALAQMPGTAAALAADLLSWSQARAITRAVRPLDAPGRAEVDRLVATHAPRLRDAEPEAVVWLVQDEVARLRQDLALRREDRAIATGFLALQPRLGGGGSLYGEADTEGFATIASALEAAAGAPVDPEAPGAVCRARQRMDALRRICEASLAGGATGTRPRPRLVATVDLATLAGMGLSEGARVLAAVAGRPGRITPLAAQVLACDAEVVPVLFSGARPVGVGDTSPTVPAKVRTALVARDGGCRFPGCGAPASWCDAHHVRPRHRGGDARVENLVLLCRRCHRRVHRHRWRITPRPDGAIAFGLRGRTYASVPRTRPPPRE